MAALSPQAASLACRVPIAPGGRPAAEAITWTVPALNRGSLDAWCSSTGPPVIAPRPGRVLFGSGEDGELVVITWNIHGGAADLGEFVRRLRSGAHTNGRPVERFVLLLQEAFRGDRLVPRVAVPGVSAPRAVGGGAGPAGRDVVRLAQSLGLALYYAPSMRNGAPGETDQDRGNAILSTEPLSEFAAVELPFERQRRVAVAAAISGWNPTQGRWKLRVVSAHLESSATGRRLWVGATGTRQEQARVLLDAVNSERALVLGGDFNSWFGTLEPAYRTVARAIPDIARDDSRPTFALLFRLDHLFSRVPAGWTVAARRLDDRLGSDHFPILARFQLADLPRFQLAGGSTR
jgi:endonuclease/exonuclease/phosphatase family metal-dependent hydrolase